MSGFVDLHCHWVWHIDDGARSPEEGLEMLRRLRRIGFSHVVATPHMRPGMFDNRPADLRLAYEETAAHRAASTEFPDTSLGSEHFFDTDVMDNVFSGHGLPYRPSAADTDPRRSGAILVEFSDLTPLTLIEQKLFQLQTNDFVPVIAHPERYRATWSDPSIVQRLVDLGSVALLDISALVGKYGARAKQAAEFLLEEGVYDAACTDSHRPADVDAAESAIDWVEQRYGREEVELILGANPLRLLHGKRPERA